MARPRFLPHERGLIATAAAIVFTRVFAFSLVLPGFHDWALTLTHGLPRGTAELLVGVALGAYGLTMALMQLVMGILSDRIGRRPVLLIGTGFFVAGSLWAATAHSIEALIAARLLQGLGGVSSAAMAAVGETVPEERRTTAMAFIGIPAGLGFFLGFILGPILQPSLGMNGLFFATAGLGVLAGLPAAIRALPAPLHGLARPGDAASLRLPVMSLALAGFTINAAMSTVAFFLPRIPISHTGLALVLIGAFVIMGGASRAIDRSRATWLPISAFLALLSAGAALFIDASTSALVLAGGLAFFASHAVLSAALPSQVSRLAGRSGGRGHGIQLVVAYLGTSLGGTLAGRFYDRPALALAILASIACASAAIIAFSLRAPQPPQSMPGGPVTPATEPSNQDHPGAA